MGAFGSAISPGAGSPIQEAMARRQQGGGASPFAQQSPSAPSAQALPQAPTTPMPSQGGQAPSAQAAQPTAPVGEASLIIKALSNRLGKLP